MVAAHGHPRLTKDLDIWVWVDPENAKRLAAVLDEFDFDECWGRRTEVLLDSLAVPFIGLEDLERNKLAAGRFQDLADMEALLRNRASSLGSDTSGLPQVR